MPDLHSIAKAALLEITSEATIGAPSGQVEEAGATTVTFLANMAGYPGWHWTVSIATLDDAEPSVLEVELMPGNGALLAPDWVPWSERLADYEAAQEALSTDSDDADSDDSDSEESDDEESDDEDDDDDDLGSDVLHGGDHGVDIDEAVESDDDESDDDSDDDDPDEESELEDDDSDDEDDDLDDEGDDRTY